MGRENLFVGSGRHFLLLRMSVSADSAGFTRYKKGFPLFSIFQVLYTVVCKKLRSCPEGIS